MTTSAARANTPGPPGSLITLLTSASRDPLGFFLDLQAHYGDIVAFRGGKGYFVARPEGIKHVLQDNHPNYVKGEHYRRAVRPLRGDGLTGVDGAQWRMQRHLAQPAFLRKQHEFFAATIVGKIRLLCQRFLDAAANKNRLDLQEEVARSSLDIILELIFGEDLGGMTEELASAFLVAEHESDLVSVFVPIRLPQWVPTRSHLRFRKSLRILDDFVFETIRRRREKNSDRGDLLSMYLRARDEETGQSLSDKLVRDEMVTLMSAGRAPTADAIAWTFYLLITHPDVYDRVCDETDSVVGDQVPTLSTIGSMPLSTMVLQEALRLYPPIWGFLRIAESEDEICGHAIAAGSRIFLLPYVMHRHPGIWEAPNQFVPERFLPEQVAQRHRFAWFPFGAGPHQCLGAGLAMLEAQITLAMLTRAVRLELIAGQQIGCLPRTTLKPSGPIWVQPHARHQAQ